MQLHTSSRSITLWLTVASILALWVLPWPALARPGAAEESRARLLFEIGKDRYKLAAYAGALANFHEALRLVPRASVLLMIAHCYRRLEIPDRALRYYREYLLACERERPGQKAPYRAVVQEHIGALRQAMEVVDRAEALMSRDPRAAVEALRASPNPKRSPRVELELALAHERLGEKALAARSIQLVIEFWDRFVTAWEIDAPGERAPEFLSAEAHLWRLRQMQRRILASPATRPGDVSDPPRVAGRSTFWLASGISAAALTLGAEALAWTYFAWGENEYSNSPAFDHDRTLTIVGHVLAATMAVTSAVSFYLYYRSGRRTLERRAGMAVSPGRGGLLAGAWLRF